MASERVRPRGTPTGLTPIRLAKRKSTGSASCTRLSFTKTGKASVDWSNDEKIVLVEFVLLHGGGHWIYRKTPSLWEAASNHLKMRCGSVRTSKFLCWGMI